MDEPLSNLDAKLRVQMRTEVARLQKDLSTTTVYVTHDQTEAMTLGDRVAVMRAGELQQVGAPSELYEQPGEPVRRRLHRLAGDELHAGDARGRHGEAAVRRRPPARGAARPARRRRAGRDVIAGVRPGVVRGRLAGRRRARRRPRADGEDRAGRVDGLRALRLLRDRVRGDPVEGARRAGRRLGRRRGARLGLRTRWSRGWRPRARSSAARRPSSGSTPASSTSSTRRPASASGRERRAHGGPTQPLRSCAQPVDEGVLVAGGAAQLLAQGLDHLVVPGVRAQQQVAQADHASVGLGLGAAAAEAGLAHHLGDRLVLLAKPGLGHLLAAEELAPRLHQPQAPGLDPLGEPRVVEAVRRGGSARASAPAAAPARRTGARGT